MEADSASKMLVNIKQSTRRHISEDLNLYEVTKHRRKLHNYWDS
jgi:hypothetical protein